MSKVMFSFPDKLVLRMKAVIPARERSKVLADLLEQEIKIREKHLYTCGKELEESKGLKEEKRHGEFEREAFFPLAKGSWAHRFIDGSSRGWNSQSWYGLCFFFRDSAIPISC